MISPIARLKSFLFKARRVVLVSTKPDPEEFKVSSKITGLGMIIIGVIGFIIFMIFTLLGSAVGGL